MYGYGGSAFQSVEDPSTPPPLPVPSLAASDYVDQRLRQQSPARTYSTRTSLPHQSPSSGAGARLTRDQDGSLTFSIERSAQAVHFHIYTAAPPNTATQIRPANQATAILAAQTALRHCESQLRSEQRRREMAESEKESFAFRINELSKRLKAEAEKAADARAEKESLARRLKDLANRLKAEEVSGAKAREAQKKAEEEAIRLHTEKGTMVKVLAEGMEAEQRKVAVHIGHLKEGKKKAEEELAAAVVGGSAPKEAETRRALDEAQRERDELRAILAKAKKETEALERGRVEEECKRIILEEELGRLRAALDEAQKNLALAEASAERKPPAEKTMTAAEKAVAAAAEASGGLTETDEELRRQLQKTATPSPQPKKDTDKDQSNA